MDSSTELAAEARHAFAAGLDAGEARLHLARQALLIAAEDDAIGEQAAKVWCCTVTSSAITVPLHALQATSQPGCSS